MKHPQKSKSRSYDQAKLKIVCDDLCDNIEELLNVFDIEYKIVGKMISMACPIHGGDNMSALNLYHEGESYRGNWKCRSHGCEEHFKGSILGFVRGVLSNRNHCWQKNGDSTETFDNSLDFALKFLNKNLSDIKISRSQREKKLFASMMTSISSSKQHNEARVPRQHIRNSLDLNYSYFKNRGFASEILDRYDVGLCNKPDKEMYNRMVVPIYNEDYEYMVGCTGRSIFDKCNKCESFHDPNTRCPDQTDLWKYSKWKHNFKFKAQDYLYNYWFAKSNIQETKTAIIVESPGNVWKLEECGIKNSIAIFGTSLGDRQKMILDSSGAMQLILLLDNDEAGKKSTINITNKCIKTYNVQAPTFIDTDIADMNCEEIIQNLKPYGIVV